jgi:hypothetical protein
MKDVAKVFAICNALVRCTMAAGITVAAMHFNNPIILGWYILVGLMAPTYESK